MFEPIHMQYVLRPPGWGRYTRSELFDLLDQLDSDARDELLTPVYLAYQIPFEEKGTRKEINNRCYEAFKNAFLALNAKCRDDNYLLFGLVSFVLGEAARRSDVGRMEQFIKGHREHLSIMREEMVKEEMPASEAWRDIRGVMDQIESLHKELEVSRRAYRLFCVEVVKPLLEEEAS
jgi:hypothetical protein